MLKKYEEYGKDIVIYLTNMVVAGMDDTAIINEAQRRFKFEIFTYELSPEMIREVYEFVLLTIRALREMLDIKPSFRALEGNDAVIKKLRAAGRVAKKTKEVI